MQQGGRPMLRPPPNCLRPPQAGAAVRAVERDALERRRQRNAPEKNTAKPRNTIATTSKGTP